MRARDFAVVTFLFALPLAPSAAHSQSHGLKLAAGDVGLGIGDVSRLDGIRLNFRDRYLERVRGINVTIWSPYDRPRGTARGLALGLPLTGAGEMSGLAIAAGIDVDGRFSGVGLAPVGFGAGDGISGIAVGGVGVGAGGELKGLGIGGVGVEAQRITGIALAGFGAGGTRITGVALAPAYVKIEEGGVLEGAAVSAFNNVRGRQRGLTIGILNIAEELHGLQIGLLNIAWNKDSFPVLPIANYSR